MSIVVLLIAGALQALSARETAPAAPEQGAAAGKSVPQVSLLTVAPGPLVYELDGHTALRFSDPASGTDYVVNWGVFDFAAPNFLYRFVKGETDYMAWPFPFEEFLREYRRQGREVTEQVLDLTPEQTVRLENMVYINLLPRNRTYRYNYIYDNCATRPLDLIERAVAAPIEFSPAPGFVYGETGITDSGAPTTFRKEMARAHADYPWYQFGIDLALGSGLDKELTQRERTYNPLYLSHLLRDAYYTDPLGDKHPLVKATLTPLPGGKATEGPTPWYLTPMAASLLVLLLTAAVSLADLRRRRVSRWLDTVYYSLCFLEGLLLTFLIFVSVHEAVSPNWLYLWLNPLCAVPAVLIWIKSCKRAVYFYQICNFVALFLLILVGVCGIQSLNNAFYPLIGADMILSARYLIVGNDRIFNRLTRKRG